MDLLPVEIFPSNGMKAKEFQANLSYQIFPIVDLL